MTTAEIGLIVSLCVMLLTVGGLIYRAGGKLATMTAEIKGVGEKLAPLSSLPERMSVVETKVENLEEDAKRFIGFDPHNVH